MGGFPYGGFPMYPNAGYPQNYPQNYPQPQSCEVGSNCDFINVNGVNQVLEHVVKPGQKLYFLDNNKPIMYTKEANSLGTTVTKAFAVSEIDIDTLINKPNEAISMSDVSREELDEMRCKLTICENQITEILNTLKSSSANTSENDRRNKNESFKSNNNNKR